MLFLTCAAAAAPPDSFQGKTILSISVFGNYKIDREIVIRVFGLKSGDPYREEQVSRGLKQVEQLSGIRSARVQKTKSPREEGVRLFLVVTEERSWHLYPHIKRNFADRISVGAVFHEAFLGGRNEQLRLETRFRGITYLGARWTKPYLKRAPFLGLEWRAAFRAYRYPFPDYQELMRDRPVKEGGTSLSLYLKIMSELGLFVRSGCEWIQYSGSEPAAPTAGVTPPTPTGAFATLETGLLYGEGNRDFYPRRGLHCQLSRKDWGVLQSRSPLKNFLYHFQGDLFFQTGRVISCLFTRCTLVHGRVPLTLRQHLGGLNTIRGYDFGVFSGDRSLLARSEFRIPLNFRDISELGNPVILVDFNLFLDGGAVWSQSQELRRESFHSGFGCGLNFIPRQAVLLKIGCAWHRKGTGKIFFDAATYF